MLLLLPQSHTPVLDTYLWTYRPRSMFNAVCFKFLPYFSILKFMMTFSTCHKIFINVITNDFNRSPKLIFLPPFTMLPTTNPFCVVRGKPYECECVSVCVTHLIKGGFIANASLLFFKGVTLDFSFVQLVSPQSFDVAFVHFQMTVSIKWLKLAPLMVRRDIENVKPPPVSAPCSPWNFQTCH